MLKALKDVPSVEIEGDINIVDVLVMVNAASSKRQAREFLTNGAISINGEVVKDFDFVISKENAIGNQFTVVKRGRKNYYLIKH